MDILIIAGVVIVLLGALLVWRFGRAPRLSKNQFYQTRSQIERTKSLDPNHGLMDSHKAFIAALQTLYPNSKTTGAGLIKRVVKRLPNQKIIWKLHRTRNQAAHEPNYEVYEKTASQARREFMRALKALR